jgi:hypothetical protein
VNDPPGVTHGDCETRVSDPSELATPFEAAGQTAACAEGLGGVTSAATTTAAATATTAPPSERRTPEDGNGTLRR